MTRQAKLHWVTVAQAESPAHKIPSYPGVPGVEAEADETRMPRGRGPAASAFEVGGGQRQSTAIAALAKVSTPIDQKIAGGTEPLLRWRPAPMPSRAPITTRMMSFVPILT